VINGPNLNLLGTREPGIYGTATLDDINSELRSLGSELKASLEFFQSNDEGALVDMIQKAQSKGIHGILINPGAYAHTSVALRDALAGCGLKFVEVHISNVYKREPFRHKSYLSDISSGIVVGFGPGGYLLALRGLCEQLVKSS
jgi:3-dehydroquinate dehydratase-2